MHKSMKILAIETSCDDTGVAVLEVSKTSNFKVLSNVIASQIKVHQKYGGVFPMMAKREHQRNLVPVFMRARKQAKLLKISNSQFLISKTEKIKEILGREPELYKKLVSFLKKYDKPKVDFISVTNGPGLEPCLWVGVNFAKALSYVWDIPVIPVNHIEGHILVNFLNPRPHALNPKSFPAIALVVSGGHTQIILVRKPFGAAQGKLFSYEILGETRDDAAGECFDKCAKILGLGYPGGPIISKMAEGIKPTNTLPRPMFNTKDYDFSFSGLKTAVLYADRKVANKNINYKRAMSAEVQQAIIDVLIKKTTKAIKDFGAKSLILGGGVSANKELRKQFKACLLGQEKLIDTELIFPEPKLSTDNGLMIAVTGYFNRRNSLQPGSVQAKKWEKIVANGNLRI